MSAIFPQNLVLLLAQANGVLAYFTTLALFVLGWQSKLFSPARVYDLFGEILSGLNMFSLLFCLFLYFKVRLYFLPTNLNSSTASIDRNG